jgi:hypothetical protein
MSAYADKIAAQKNKGLISNLTTDLRKLHSEALDVCVNLPPIQRS